MASKNFYGLSASQTTLNSDFAALRSRGFDGIRILVNWPCGGCTQSTQYRLHNYSDGSYRSGMLTRLRNLIQTAQSNNLIVDLTFMDAFDFASFTAYRTAIENTTRDIISNRNVIFDLQNEADHSYSGGGWTGNFFLPLSFSNTLANAVTAIDPNRLITTSTDASDEPSWVTNSNFDFFAPHAPVRSGDWPGNTDNYVNGVRPQLPRVMPIYLQEPERYRGTSQFNDSADDWFTAAKNAKCSGAAGWTFHTDAGYDLTGGTMFGQFNSVENQIVNGLSGQLGSTPWFSCATGIVSPTPTPQPPTPSLPAANHPIQFTYYFIDGTFGDFRNEVKSTVGPYIIIGHNWGPRLTELDAEFQRAVGDGKRIIFGPNNPWNDPTPGLLGQHLDVAKNYWNSIDWIYFDEPPYTKAETESFISNLEAMMVQRGLSLKPIGINYTDSQILTKTGFQATNLDYVGIEAYMDPSLQNDPNLVSSLNAKIDQFKSIIGNRPIFIVVQGYDRNGQWTNLESLKSIQTPAYLKAYNDTRVNALLVFSYGRAGGTRDLHQCIRTEHLRIWGAISGTSQPNSISCSGTTQPPPPPSGTGGGSIYFISPYSVPAGETILIVGENLSGTVNFYNTSRTLTTATGTLNRDGTEVTVVIPATLAPGQYTVSTGSSNEVPLEILAAASVPLPGGTGVTSAEPCDPSIIQIGVSIICDFYPESANPGDSIQMTGVALTRSVQILSGTTGVPIDINGTVSNSGQLVTFTLPSSIVPGNYTISNTGTTGTATIAKPLTVLPPSVGGQPPGGPNPPFNPPESQVLPPASSFQELITNAFNYSLIVVGIAVFIMIMWGGFLWLTSAANPANIGSAKRYITNAILGAILLVSAYVILYTINPELVGGRFILRGIEAPSSQALGVSKLIATSEAGAASAITVGCTIDIDARDFTSLECFGNIAEGLNLLSNPTITTTDSGVNNQIGATTVQNNGNLGAGRKIVVLDTGYNYNHPELRSSYLGGRDFINNDDDPMDDHTLTSRINPGQGAPPGHGSHVAGIITGDGIDTRARGVAPQVGIIAGKILDDAGDGNWDKLVDSIYWAINGRDGIYGTADDFKADAINMSVGAGLFSSTCDNNDELTKRLAKAIGYARDNGVLPIISSGNVPNGVSMPGCIDSAFTVGAVDSSDRIANFSGRGNPIDIVAPGVNIYSSLLGSNYGLKRGTSQAAPVVSGMAALLKSANPGYTPAQLEQAITSTACDLGPTGKDTTFGWGRVSLTPGSCTPPPPPPSPSGPTGTITISPTSCTKGVIASNPNCNLTMSYSITGITSATQLTVGKDGNLFQYIQCSSGSCSGQLTDTNPAGGSHNYDFRLPNNTVIAAKTAYVYSTGRITSTFNSCAIGGTTSNPNCDITLNITATGIAPNSVVVTRDGVNWRLVLCTTSPCNATLTDAGPATGIHTYALLDASNNDRLNRVTVNITIAGNVPPPSGSVVLCTGANFTGTCETFSATQTISNLANTLVGNDTVSSMRVDVGRLYLCREINYGGVCEGFGRGDYPNLGPVIGDDTASSMLESLPLQRATICSDINFNGTCEIFSTNDPDFNDNLIGNDTASSVYVDTTDIRLCRDPNYGGVCQDLPKGTYPNLGTQTIGDNQASSIGSL